MPDPGSAVQQPDRETWVRRHLDGLLLAQLYCCDVVGNAGVVDRPELTNSQKRSIECVQLVGVTVLIAFVVGLPLAYSAGYLGIWSAASIGIIFAVLLVGVTTALVSRIEQVRARVIYRRVWIASLEEMRQGLNFPSGRRSRK